MEMDLSGKTALITGGNVGIGRAIALALAESGADVAITYLSHAEEDTVSQVQALGRKAFAYELNVLDSQAVNEITARAARDLGGKIDILVNNAGGLIGRVAIADMTDEHWHQVIDVNLSSTFYCTRAVLPFMNPAGGRIINLSSLAAHNGGGNGAAAYCASKAGIDGLTRALAKELAPRKITVNAVAPGLILETPFHATFTPLAGQQATIESTPLKRAGNPNDVAGAVLFFASELASFLTGVITEINGGTWFV